MSRGPTRTTSDGVSLDLDARTAELERLVGDLAGSRRLLDAVVENSPAAIYVKDTDSRFVMTNAASAALFGCTPDEMMGTTDADHMPRELAERIYEHDREVLRTGRRDRYEETIIAQGRPRTYLSVKFPLRDETGEPVGLVGISTEITELKRAEEERERLLRNVEQERGLLTGVLESMAEGVIISDTEANVLDMNEAALRLHGFESVEQVRRNLKAWPEVELRTIGGEPVPPEDWPLGRVTRGERFVDLVVQVRNRLTGAQGIWSYSGAPVYEDGRVVRTVLTVRDITQRKLDEERLRDSVETMRLLLEAADRLAKSTGPEDVLETLVSVLQRATGRRRVTAALYDAQQEEVTIGAGIGEMAAVGTRFPLHDLAPATRRAIDRQVPQTVDYDEPGVSEESRRRAESFGYRLVLVVPLVFAGATLGYVGLDDPGSWRGFDERESRIAQGVAMEAAVALANARLLEAERTARQEARQELGITHALLKAGDAIAEWTELNEVPVRLGELLQSLTGRGRVIVDLWNEERKEVTVAASVGTLALEVGATFGLREASEAFQTAVTERRTVVADLDELPEDERGVLYRSHRLRYLLYVPMLRRDRVVGLILVDDPGERREFTAREIALVEGIAAQAAVALENGRNFAAAREQLARTNVLREVATAAATLDLQALGKRVLDTLRDSLGVTSSVLYLLDEGDDTLHELALCGYAKEVERLFDEVPLNDDSVSGRAVLRDEVERFAFEQLPPATRLRAQAAGETDAWWLVVPIHIGGRPMGNFTLALPKERQVDEDDIELLRGVSDQVGVAIENARLFESERARSQASRILAEISAMLAATRDLDQTLPEVLKRAGEQLNAAGVALTERDRDGWRIREAWGVQRPLVGMHFDRDTLPSHTKVLETRQPNLVGDVLKDAEANRPIAHDLGYRSFAIYPTLFRGDVTGTLAFSFPEPLPAFDERRTNFMSRVAFVISSTLENVRLFEAEREAARLGQSMVEINVDLASSIDVDETLPKVLKAAADELGAMGAAVTDRVDGGWRMREVVGDLGTAVRRGRFFTDAETPSLALIEAERKPRVVADVAAASNINTQVAESAGFRAYAGYPLIVRNQLIGVVAVYFSAPRELTAQELDYLRRVAFAVSLSEETSRLYRAEHRIAETLQSALLALPETMPGVRFAHMYHSATEAARVGGDFYDLFELEHHKIGITVGDISGHGVDAAVLTSLVKNAIRVQATQERTDPAAVMTAASRVLYDNSPSEIFATVFFGILHLEDGELVYCNAGHTTTASICSRGGVSRLPSNSPLIGAFADEEFSVSTARLGVHDMLFLYTDGLTEAWRGRELFGEERLFELLAKQRGGDPQRTLRQVVGDVLEFAGGALSDDLAILVVQRGE